MPTPASWQAWAESADHSGELELLSTTHEGNLIGLAAAEPQARRQPGSDPMGSAQPVQQTSGQPCQPCHPLTMTSSMPASWPEGAPPLHPFEPGPRLTPRPSSELSETMRATLARIPGEGLKGAGFPHLVLGELLYSPQLLAPFLEWWVSAKSAMALSVREQELVILRMGCLYGSDYVWKHHVPVGREFGIVDAELAAIRGGEFGGFIVREQALLVLCDEMVSRRTVSPETWARYGRSLPARDLVDLIALISQYVLFALTNNVLQVPLEEPLAGEPSLAD